MPPLISDWWYLLDHRHQYLHQHDRREHLGQYRGFVCRWQRGRCRYYSRNLTRKWLVWVAVIIIHYSGAEITLGGVIKTNPFYGITNNLVVVKNSRSSDFTEDHNHTSLSASLWKGAKVSKPDDRPSSSSGEREREILPQATLELGSAFKQASKTASETWSHILSTLKYN